MPSGKLLGTHLVLHQHRPDDSFFFHECSDARRHRLSGVGDIVSLILTGSRETAGPDLPWKRFKHSVVYYGCDHPTAIRRVDRLRRRIEVDVRRIEKLEHTAKELRARL